jgi:hypothetical protein
MPGRSPTPRRLIDQLFRLKQVGLADANAVLLDRRTRLQFDFSVQPTALARSYRCRLTLLQKGLAPEAYVLSPDLLEVADGKRPPHIYDHAEGRTQLCLYTPGVGEWTPQLWLAETMLPWTISWLRFYEIWLATGDWEGGGEHPPSEPLPPRRRFGMAARRR